MPSRDPTPFRRNRKLETYTRIGERYKAGILRSHQRPVGELAQDLKSPDTPKTEYKHGEA